jgi:predicted  nucleic acid-binding Zn-ribbon protein
MENPIKQKLRALARLQALDSKLDEIHRLRGSLPEEVADLEDDVEGLETRKGRIDAEIERLNSEISQKKTKIEDFTAQIKKYEDQQMNVKNNREFEALAKEIEFSNLEILTSEKKIRQFQDQIEAKNDLLEETTLKIQEKMLELDEKKEELDVIVKETKKEEKRMKDLTEKAAEEVEARILNGYRKIRNNMRNGLAVVATDRDACGGCFSVIPPQVSIELKQQSRLIHCENCGRILIDQAIVDEVREDLTEAASI